jgi:transcription elongation factor SPT4
VKVIRTIEQNGKSGVSKVVYKKLIMERIPETRKQRACLLCSMVKSLDQFYRQGCENCEEVLSLKQDQDRIMDCTSSQFEGLIALMNEKSWVGRWQRIDKFHKGIYAVQVSGRLPVDVEEMLMDRGIKYRVRDGSLVDCHKYFCHYTLFRVFRNSCTRRIV